MPGAPRFCPIGCPCAGSAGGPSGAGAPDLASMILAASSYNSLLAAHAGLGAFSSMPALSLASTSTPSVDHSTTTTTTANAQRNGHRTHNTANMCNWVSIDGPCLKKFDTAEELMNHLRTHANQVHKGLILDPNELLNYSGSNKTVLARFEQQRRRCGQTITASTCRIYTIPSVR
jgi:hypothetical protein